MKSSIAAAARSILGMVNLSNRELALYNKIAPALSQNIPKPDLVIYLQASTEILMKRIGRRNFSFEKAIDYDYIDMVNKAYDYFFFDYSDTPLLVVKTDEIDFVNTPEHFDDLLDQISKPVSGKKYYAPSGNLARNQ